MSFHRNSATSFPISFFLILAACIGIAYQPEASATERNLSKIQTGAERGSILKEIELGAAYLSGKGVARDLKQAAYWYEKAANSGDPGAQLEVGYFYQAGIGVDRDPAQAAKWFERAASSGLPSAKVNLGVAYVWGLGVRKDPEFGAQLFRDAAKKKDGAGACYLGDMYYFGLGVPRDPAEARRWFELGSKLHNSTAKFNLAMVLLNERDPSREREAMKLLRESAQGGYVRAKHQLGLMMVRNPALEETPGDALATLQEAAADGSWKSSVVLGILARDGRSGVARDGKSAYYHFEIAILQGGETTAKMLASDLRALESQLSSSEISSLRSDAVAWMSSHDHPLQFANIHVEEPQYFPAFGLEDADTHIHAGMLISSHLGDDAKPAGKAFR